MAHSNGSQVDLAAVASVLAAPGKGLLASDESTGTIGKRLAKVGLENSEDVRRAYRALFYTAPIGDYISGAIMYKETLYQKASDGTPFVECLQRQGAMAGIKVDEGLVPVEEGSAETSTRGLDNLAASCKEYVAAGARFAKWRAALKFDVASDCPSERCVELNAQHLAQYAAICQACGLVPIVEPEILIDGAHSISEFGEVSERVISACAMQLWREGVLLEGCLLKPQMIIPGADWPGAKATPEEVARHTLRVLRRTLPAAVPGVMFLSGGQSEEEATINLNAINVEAQKQPGSAPWSLSFSFGRALQASVLRTWAGEAANADKAKSVAVALAAANSAAALGRYDVQGQHPSAAAAAGTGGAVASLREDFRGWSGAAAPGSQA